MKKLFLASFFVLLLIFGCIDFGEKPITHNVTNKTTVVIKVEPQKNATIITNKSEEEEEKPPEKEGLTYRYEPMANLGIYFIDACDYENNKQASAILIKKEDFDMLIDAGSANSVGRVFDFLKSRGVDDIEVFVSTAEDEGKYGGMQKIAEEFKIEEFWWSGQATTTSYKEAVDFVKQKAKKTIEVSQGYNRDLNGIVVEVLNPEKKTADIYNDAIVLLLTDRGKKTIILSNVKGGGQGNILNKYKEKILKPDFMEAPYYGLGAGTSAIGIFLDGVKPKNVIVEGCEEGREKTRTPFFILLNQYKIDYWETYKKGTIRAIISTQQLTSGVNATTTAISSMQ
ncbi:MAG: hypothetical protein QXF35_03360 [Candidatus Bilamarchaeaceae archaeon]